MDSGWKRRGNRKERQEGVPTRGTAINPTKSTAERRKRTRYQAARNKSGPMNTRGRLMYDTGGRKEAQTRKSICRDTNFR